MEATVSLDAGHFHLSGAFSRMKIGPFLAEILTNMLIFPSMVPQKPGGTFIGEFSLYKMIYNIYD